MSKQVDTLGEALPREIQRIRDEVLPEYLSIGPSGTFAVTLMRRYLDMASKAMIAGDTVEMIRVYHRLKGWKL